MILTESLSLLLSLADILDTRVQVSSTSDASLTSAGVSVLSIRLY